MKHSSVNGLVNEQIVQEMYDMLVGNSRKVWITLRRLTLSRYSLKGRIEENLRSKIQEKVQLITLVIFVVLLIPGERIARISLHT